MRIPGEHSVTPPTLDCYAEARDAFVGDPASELAALLIDHVRESRQSHLEQTRAEEMHLRVVQAAQVGDLRAEADHLRNAGITRGLGLILSGGLSISSGLVSASNAKTTETGVPSGGPPSPPKGPSASDWSGVLGGAAPAAQGFGELGAALFEREAGYARANAAEHEHLGSEAERRIEASSEARSHARELQGSAFEHLETIQETRAATDRALTSWRG